MTRCGCGNRIEAPGARACAACLLWRWTDATYARQAAKAIGLRERIKARWPSYDEVGADSPDGLAAHVQIEGEP